LLRLCCTVARRRVACAVVADVAVAHGADAAKADDVVSVKRYVILF